LSKKKTGYNLAHRDNCSPILEQITVLASKTFSLKLTDSELTDWMFMQGVIKDSHY